jgi:hypothetical protein
VVTAEEEEEEEEEEVNVTVTQKSCSYLSIHLEID